MTTAPPIPPNTQAILWDMDGVLVNSEEIWEACYPDFMRDNFGIKDFDLADYAFVIGKTIPSIYASLCERYEELTNFTVEDFVRAEKSFGLKNIYPNTVMYRGVRDFLDTCKARGIPMGIVSSSPSEWIDACVEKHDLAGYFEILVSGYVENLSKPDPAIYVLGAERIGVDPKNCLVIEDSPSGVQSGKGAGMTIWGYRNGSNDEVDLSLADEEFYAF